MEGASEWFLSKTAAKQKDMWATIILPPKMKQKHMKTLRRVRLYPRMQKVFETKLI